MNFSLQFKKSEISYWSSGYKVDTLEDCIENKLRSTIQANKYLTSTQLLKLCEWKTSRTKSRVAKKLKGIYTGRDRSCIFYTKWATTNWSADPASRSKLALSFSAATFWEFRAVSYLDFRALWSLGLRVPKQYDFQFWWTYTQFCRKLSVEGNVTMRILDRALWQFSKENQK